MQQDIRLDPVEKNTVNCRYNWRLQTKRSWCALVRAALCPNIENRAAKLFLVTANKALVFVISEMSADAENLMSGLSILLRTEFIWTNIQFLHYTIVTGRNFVSAHQQITAKKSKTGGTSGLIVFPYAFIWSRTRANDFTDQQSHGFLSWSTLRITFLSGKKK